jgi:hypothetical protein
VPPVTYTDIAVLRCSAGLTARAINAPSGWYAPEPSPAAAASASTIPNDGAKPIVAKSSAVQISASPIRRVPKRSASQPKNGWASDAIPE